MKTKIITFLIILVTFWTVYAQNKKITLEDIFENNTFSEKGLPALNFTKNEHQYTMLVNSQVVKYDILSGALVEVLFDLATDGKDILKGKLGSFVLSSDESKILLETGTESIYRYSRVGEYYVFDIKSKLIQRIFPKGKIKYPLLNAASDAVAFVFENNLYYQNLKTQKVVQITKDGKQNAVINGASDWVYEEEFVLTRAFEWSPDGSQIAFLRLDEINVKEVTLEYFNNEAYPKKSTFKYPKVGELNSELSVWSYSLKKKKLISLNIGPREDDYIPRILWSGLKDELCVTWLNREQNHLKLILVNTSENTSRILLEEVNKYYIDVHNNLKFLKNGNFIWTSESDGYNHIYLYNSSGNLIRQVTRGVSEVSEVYGLDTEENEILYQVVASDGLERQIFKVFLDSKKIIPIASSPGFHTAKISPGLRHIILSSSDSKNPVIHRIVDREGHEIRMLENNEAIRNMLKDYTLSDVEFIKIKNRNNTELNSFIIKPALFNPLKKYPVFMFLYGGPGSQEVLNKWNATRYYWWFQLLAQKDYIICVVDNRGTGGKGEEFKKMTYLQLGKFETEDQIDAARYLGSQSFVDSSRIGIFGWSYGGFMATLCLLKGNDVFKSAIAVAPVTNWKWYDSVYTERYMRRIKDNQKGYDENSPVNFADRLKGNYLLVHGMADDNVHFQNTAEMVNELIKNKKQFDTYFYPNRNHGIREQNARIHLFTKMTSFILEKL